MPYKIDPYFRDAAGRFVPRPEVMPEPLTLIRNTANVIKRPSGRYLLVRAILDGASFRVVISERTK